MRRTFLEGCLLAALLAFCPGAAQAEEELAPGYSACMEQSGGVTANMQACTQAALQYWDTLLNANYRWQQAASANAVSPDARRAALLKAERAWIAYRDSMAEYLNDPEGGSLARLIALDFMAETTRMQARYLSPYR